MTAAPGIVLSHFPANRGGNCAKDHGKRCGAATHGSAFGSFLANIARLCLTGLRAHRLSLHRGLIRRLAGLRFQLIDLLLQSRRQLELASLVAVIGGKVCQARSGAD